MYFGGLRVELGMTTVLNLCKIVLLVYAVLASSAWYLWRIADIGSLAGIVVFLLLMVLCMAAILAAAYCKYVSVRLVSALCMMASAVMVESYRAIVSEPLTFDSFVMLINAAAFTGDALSHYSSQIVRGFAIGTSLFVSIILPSRLGARLSSRVSVAFSMMPLAVVLLLSAIVYLRGGAGVKGLPSALVALPYSVVRTAEYIAFDRGNRAKVTIPVRADAERVDVVLIIDESVRGDYLDINGAENVTSGLLGRDGTVHNYAFAASATNCSDGTNLILRYGGTRENYHKWMNTKPSIWEYASAAGLKAVYLDAQRTGRGLQNHMYADETQQIDMFVQFGETEIVDRDMRVAEAISRLTRNDEAELIVVNKLGAHFPVHDKYPDAFMRFLPVSRRGSYTDVTDTGDKSGFDGDWERYRNAYRNTITWNVGEFFRILFERADLERAFLVYTSDHGQDFHEDGSPGLAFHCSSSPSPNEGLVPMVVITGHPRLAELAATWNERNRNRTSHYNIFPTLLLAMGYPADDVRKMYGPSLFNPTDDPLSFLSRFDRFGRAPKWTVIELPPINMGTGDASSAPTISGAPTGTGTAIGTGETTSAFRPFTSTSYWNRPLPVDAPIDINNDRYIAYAKDPRVSDPYPGLTGAPGANQSYAAPIVWASKNDPLYTIIPRRYGKPVDVHIPLGAIPQTGSDGALWIIDKSADLDVLLWRASFDGHQWSAASTTQYRISSNGLHRKAAGSDNPQNDGHRGVPPNVQLVRLDEVRSGAIEHRLACYWHATGRPDDSTPWYYWPMTGYERNKGGITPEGLVIRIKPSVDLSKKALSPVANIIATTLQRYGCIISDNSGGTNNRIKLEYNEAAWAELDPELDGRALDSLTWDDWEFIQGGYNPPAP